ncbi:MAG: glycosyl transferase, family 39 [Acidobacteria bacterium]|jgi:hypothetical protein|nr:glycosyl transferase, family 39 [Acidobacteriota bacterium]
MRLSDYLYHHRTIYYLLFLCFLCRVILVLTIDPFGSDTVDGMDYHNHAISLLNGNGYPLHGSLPFVRPPLYPFFLSILYYIFPHESYLTARLFNAVLDTAACYVFYKLILLIWNNRPTALLATLVYIVNPFYLFFNARVRVEALFILLGVTGVYFLVREYKNNFPSLFNLFLIGCLFGLACLCRSNATIFALLIPVWMIYCNLKNLKKGVLIAAIFGIGCVLTIAPWSIRNSYSYGETILISDGLGYAFWISNTELKFDDLYARNYEEYLEADKKLWRETAAVEAQIKDKSTVERSNHYLKLSIEYIKADFPRWIWLNVIKFAEFWSPMARLDMQGWKAFATLPFGLLMLLGMFFYAKSFFSTNFDRNIWLLIAILIFGSTVTGVMTWSSVRFRVPLVDAYIIPFGLFWLQNKYLKHFSRSSEAADQIV